MKNIALPPKPWQQRLNIFTHSTAKTKKQRKRKRMEKGFRASDGSGEKK